MKPIQLAIAVVVVLFCTPALAGGPVWNPIPIAPPTGTYYQPPPAPDYTNTIDRGFSQLQDAFRQYEARQPSTAPSDKYSFPDGSRGVMVNDYTMFVIAVDGTEFLCSFIDGKRSDCKPR